ncbi:hypothetical protein HY489_06680 [Candidatus Woesearchaeota archaeon]|nr:hypothetical protein [Candidatus Woesearchaeota archaeon]
MNIYVCGNPLVDEDSLPIKILPMLRRNHPAIQFTEFDPTEDLPKAPELTFIDTVINAKDVVLLKDIDAFVQTKALSLHDFDLGINLKLAKKIGQLKSVRIIGVPPKTTEKDALIKIGKIISNLT